MCWATTITLSCVDCDRVINIRKDYGMCESGREANFWGICCNEKVEYQARPGVCFDCFTEKRERRKQKAEEEKTLKEMEEE
ncbi:hypothetical protein NW766_008602 [Fusarium irregulare]|uniref:Uncharacterized protein n=1 Tax=Fusarium irregulare TaxID=2494466 RepID=A0A9W8PK19_9HYPO|nr:hypothetical protein NW766_008602 [Fusarium irregulare]